MLRLLPDSVLSILYPQACDVCDGEVRRYRDGVACTDCWNATRIFNGNETLCDKCGAFLFETASLQPTYCRRCDDHFYDRAIAVGVYEKALAASVLRLKRTPLVPSVMKTLIVERARNSDVISSSLVIPVPLSDRRRHERGYNQAAVIASLVARQMRLPFDDRTLVRRIHTPVHRAGMDKKGRAMTVKNAFDVGRPRLVDGQNVLLIDDVMTSGETVSMCAKELKKNGAATVTILTIARAAF